MEPWTVVILVVGALTAHGLWKGYHADRRRSEVYDRAHGGSHSTCSSGHRMHRCKACGATGCTKTGCADSLVDWTESSACLRCGDIGAGGYGFAD